MRAIATFMVLSTLISADVALAMGPAISTQEVILTDEEKLAQQMGLAALGCSGPGDVRKIRGIQSIPEAVLNPDTGRSDLNLFEVKRIGPLEQDSLEHAVSLRKAVINTFGQPSYIVTFKKPCRVFETIVYTDNSSFVDYSRLSCLMSENGKLSYLFSGMQRYENNLCKKGIPSGRALIISNHARGIIQPSITTYRYKFR